MKYMGSKSRVAKYIVPIIQKYIDDNNIDTYYEPFVVSIQHHMTLNVYGSQMLRLLLINQAEINPQKNYLYIKTRRILRKQENEMTIRQTDNKELASKIRQALKDNNGYCPCMVKQTEDTKCMCKNFRKMEEGTCYCGLYNKTKD